MNEKTTDQEQRRRLVARAMTLRGVTMPAVLDTEDEAVENAFAAWPVRMIVVDPSGEIELDVRFQPHMSPPAVDVGNWLAKRFGSTVH